MKKFFQFIGIIIVSILYMNLISCSEDESISDDTNYEKMIIGHWYHESHSSVYWTWSFLHENKCSIRRRYVTGEFYENDDLRWYITNGTLYIYGKQFGDYEDENQSYSYKITELTSTSLVLYGEKYKRVEQ